MEGKSRVRRLTWSFGVGRRDWTEMFGLGARWVWYLFVKVCKMVYMDSLFVPLILTDLPHFNP
jgi:hypothetical protein